MKHEKLKVEKRKVLGKNVKKLRRIGVLPANVYGKDIKSTAVQLPTKEFSTVYREAGETGLVDLTLEGTIIPVLIQNVYKNFRGNYLHADFFKVNLKEKVKANIPLEVIGEPKAVTEKIGILMNIISEVEVEALPTELPEKIEVNVEHLTNIDDQITVADLKVSAEVTVLTDPNQVVSKIGELVTKEAQEQAAQEAAAAQAASTAEGAAEGQAPVEGEVTEGEAQPQVEGEVKPTQEQPKQEG
ncbi:MAG: 50S ribosomal protein L25 [Candidatus Levybacteria bacterium GW2011_GWB1_35_5]|nr:MAG: 50S ribosomal protein L25 [Candidatus Levybacteria bacterium GW2011_GWB1_35_5]